MIPLCWRRAEDRLTVQAQARVLATSALPLEAVATDQLALLLEDGSWQLTLQGRGWHPDWLQPDRLRRYRQASLKREALARACGLKAGQRPAICDATAGLAQDATVLAVLGSAVTLLEAHPVVHLLLHQAWRRACEHPDFGPAFARMRLFQGDSLHWLRQQATAPDVIYLDPMFARHDLKAQVSKPMQLLRRLQADWPVSASEAEALLREARQRAGQRVVVKRARRAPPLLEPPHHAIEAGNCRFDVYMKN